MAALKHSRQRETIKSFLMGRTDHPTADTIYSNIREIIPNISLGTVYRNLALLSEIGEIQKLSVGNGPDHFDGEARPHDHFICEKCQSVLDIPASTTQDHSVDEVAQAHFDGIIRGHSTLYYGICKNCK